MNNKSVFSASALKWIAIISMLIDHIGIILVSNGVNPMLYYCMRGVGRLAFPLFCFLLIEGFVNTSSFSKYVIRLLVFAIVSEIPYDLLNFGSFNLMHNNILFTFVIALLMVYAISKCETKGTKGMLLTFLYVTIAAGVAILLKAEYSWKCVFLAAFFYIARRNFVMRNITAAVVLLIDISVVGLIALVALIPINLYNGEKGKLPKWLGYGFYPLHMLALWGINFLYNNIRWMYG